MVKNHLKSLAAPKTWEIPRKKNKFITRPLPSGHAMKFSIPITLSLKTLGKTRNEKETTLIIKSKQVLVDGRIIKDKRQSVGLFDVMSIPSIKESYRLILTKKGKLKFVQAEDSDKKVVSITTKKMHKGKIQYTMNDGTTILSDNKEYKVGDSLVLSLPEKKILKHLKMQKGMMAYLIGGNNLGQISTIEKIEGNKVFFKSGDKKYETLKKYAFVIGEKEPEIKIGQ